MISEEEEKGNYGPYKQSQRKRNLSSLCKIFNRTRKKRIHVFVLQKKEKKLKNKKLQKLDQDIMEYGQYVEIIQ